MKVYFLYVVLVIGLTIIPTTQQKKNKKRGPYWYLAMYGYQEPMSDRVSHALTAEGAIRKFQRYAQLPVTGKMNKATEAKLMGPRCGARDITKKSAVAGFAVSGVPVPSFRDMRRKKRYVQQGTVWRKRTLTWSLQNYPSRVVGMTHKDVVKTLNKAFNMWQSVTQLNFRRVGNNILTADIIVKFGRLNHGDPYLFDGQGGTLAHAFYPNTNTGLSGDIHFDDDETWSIKGQLGTTDFKWTSIHEIGHAIGLEHSEKRNAIMWPWFEGFQRNVKLKQDDVKGIQSIYGVRKVRDTCASNNQNPKVSTVCYYTRFDEIVYHKQSCITYIFRGWFLWRMDGSKRAGTHERISSVFPGLTSHIDAAYTRNDGTFVFIKRQSYWIYDKTRRKIQGPTALRYLIKNAQSVGLDRIDAALVWDGNNRLYFFRKNKYFRYNENSKTIDRGYPRSTSLWRGVQTPVDAAFSWRKSKTFFLNGSKIDKYSNSKFRVQKRREINKFIYNC